MQLRQHILQFVRNGQPDSRRVLQKRYAFVGDVKEDDRRAKGRARTAEQISVNEMDKLRDILLAADMAVLVTPLYYFGVSAQLKTVIDRFYSFTTRLSEKKLKTALVVTAWDSNNWTMLSIRQYYETLCRYLNFQDQGMMLGTGCGTVSMTRNTEFPQLSYELGKSV